MLPFKIEDWFENREDLRTAFLERTGWAGASLRPLGEDCSFRRYFRLEREGGTAVLMEAVPDGEAIATPGHSLKDFIRIAALLRVAGFKSPAIYEADEQSGYLLLEDFGDMSFRKALAAGQDAQELYGLATDVLMAFRETIKPETANLPDYYQTHIHIGRRRIVDWYLPALRNEKNPDGLAEEYLAVWNAVEAALPPCPQGFVHGDYHIENLMYLPGGKELGQCGILDFQGAMIGPLPYDLTNLLEGARATAPESIRVAMMARYCAGMSAEDKTIFETWYRVIAAQFHCRIAGQFIRLAVRDGKARYLQYLPQVTKHLREGLDYPVLKPLQDWFTSQGLSFESTPDFNTAQIKNVIRQDAF